MGLVRQVTDLELIFTKSPYSNTITEDDIKEVSITEEELNGGHAIIVINNRGGAHKTDFYEGWDVEFKVQFDGEGSKTTFWKGVVLKKYPQRHGYNDQWIVVEAMDEGTYLLSGIVTTETHNYASVDAGYIIAELIDDYTSLGYTNIDETTGRTISMTIPVGRNVLDTIRELSMATGYSFFVDHADEAWLVERGAAEAYTLGATEGSNFVVDRDILSVKNDILVKGAYISDPSAAEQAGPPDGYWDVDNAANRRKHKFTPEGTIIQVSVTGYNPNASTKNIMLRIQPDDGTGNNPVAISDYNADIGGVFVPNGLLPTSVAGTSVGGNLTASLVDGESDYWLIAEADAAGGNLPQVGYKTVSAVDTLIHSIYSRAEITGTASDATSQTNYGERAYTFIDRTLVTQAECNERAAAILAEYKDIAETVACSLDDDIFDGDHAQLGDKVTVTLADEDINAEAMGLIMVTWSFISDNGVWCDISIMVGDTAPPLNEGDFNANVCRRIDALGNKLITMEAAQSIVPAHSHEKHTDRDRYEWISAGQCMGYYNGSVIDCLSSGTQKLPGIRLRGTTDDTIVGAIIYRPGRYVSGGSYQAVFVTDDEADEGDQAYIDYQAQALAEGEAMPSITSYCGSPQASEFVDIDHVSSKIMFGSWQSLPSWSADEIMIIALSRDYQAGDTPSIAFLGFWVKYTADQ